MPELRQTVVPLDMFNRPDEVPIASPWVTPLFGTNVAQLNSNAWLGTGIGNQSSWSYWNDDPYPMSLSSGDTPEVWATAITSYQFPEGTRMALFDSSGAGWAVLMTGGFSLILRMYTGGGGFSDVTGSMDGGDAVYTGSGDFQMCRITSTHFEVWRTEAGDWILTASVPHGGSFVDGLFGTLGATGNEDGWDDFGGGPVANWHPEFLRRPWEYQGKALTAP